MIDRAAAAHATWSTTGAQPYDPEHPGLSLGLEAPFKSPPRRDSAYPFALDRGRPTSRQGSTCIPPHDI